MNNIISSLDAGKNICFIFSDIFKAFDRVWHLGLVKKQGWVLWVIYKAGLKTT